MTAKAAIIVDADRSKMDVILEAIKTSALVKDAWKSRAGDAYIIIEAKASDEQTIRAWLKKTVGKMKGVKKITSNIETVSEEE